ncbi:MULTISPECIES: LLM class F420-dependent oxidoreductase [unclassified Amycolatopsis]|uniref:LLM class F420-dependent oxidoreductase n=1 Tax=unclassified Amycolatopsis TaxID=2618356 RepID=UPI001FF29D29|nr:MULTISPECIES: LLM class F420-dependent oxidoreductase [unclassified Amycolatopsis]UOZ06163.1 LLM class F420-dependent oxidoreductase [Amycolatopsis sp. WQ 127309]WSK74851.1 LLM class F420-dependent oxidoreductase [Amycolatopsis sp. NBC_01286]
MKIGTAVSYSGGFADSVADVVELEKAGLDIVFVPEAYSFDAVSQLGYLAAKTERVQLASGIFQIYTRTPTLTAMTAAGLDFVSDGRFVLGLGASGPQVIEGFHGVKYDAPLGRTREIVEVCRQVWRRERVVHEGKHYTIPLPPEQGSGLGKPLKLINHPVRERIPVLLASIGPKNVALTAEIAEGWQPIFFHPEKAADVWGASLAEGQAKRDPALGELDTYVTVALAIGDDVEALLDHVRPVVALYVGGMGARGKNFYNDLACRYGYEAEAKLIQDLYLDGKKAEAAAAVPLELLRAISLVGPAGYVKERLAAFAEAGATTVIVNPLQPGREGRVAAVSQLRELIG